MATDTLECTGRVGGVGGSNTPSQYWGKSTQSRREAELQSQKDRSVLLEQNRLLSEQVKIYAEERKSFEERLRRVERDRGRGGNEGPSYLLDQVEYSSPFQQWLKTPSFQTDFGTTFPYFGGQTPNMLQPQCPPHQPPRTPSLESQTPHMSQSQCPPYPPPRMPPLESQTSSMPQSSKVKKILSMLQFDNIVKC